MSDARERWVLGTELLKEFRRDDLAIARALKQKRWKSLAAAAELAWLDVDKRLALTDPALYRSLRDAITLFHLKGWGSLDRNVLRQRAGWLDRHDAESPSPKGMDRTR
jgi:hypothetical protein